jgi:hypothetical protein
MRPAQPLHRRSSSGLGRVDWQCDRQSVETQNLPATPDFQEVDVAKKRVMTLRIKNGFGGTSQRRCFGVKISADLPATHQSLRPKRGGKLQSKPFLSSLYQDYNHLKQLIKNYVAVRDNPDRGLS